MGKHLSKRSKTAAGHNKNTHRAVAEQLLQNVRKKAIVILPYIPEDDKDIQDRQIRGFLGSLAKKFDVLCSPEGPTKSWRRVETDFSARGIRIYSLAQTEFKRTELAAHIRKLITENPLADRIFVCGSPAIQHHMFQLRLFAPHNNYFAILQKDDLAALKNPELPLINRLILKSDLQKHLSNAHAVIAPEPELAGQLSEYLDMDILSPDRFFRNETEIIKKKSAIRLGVASLPEAGDFTGFFHKKYAADIPPGTGFFKYKDIASLSRAVSADRRFDTWLIVNRPFESGPDFLKNLIYIYQVLGDAGAIIPATIEIEPKASGASVPFLLEAAALSRRGFYREPMYISNSPCLLVRKEAFAKTGGTDPRFKNTYCALTDLALRMAQAGHRSVVAEDIAAAVIKNIRPEERPDQELELLTKKWCADSLRFMELLVSEIKQ